MTVYNYWKVILVSLMVFLYRNTMAETYTLNFILMKKSSFHNIDNDHHISGHDYSCGACYEICPFLCVCVCACDATNIGVENKTPLCTVMVVPHFTKPALCGCLRLLCAPQPLHFAAVCAYWRFTVNVCVFVHVYFMC